MGSMTRLAAAFLAAALLSFGVVTTGRADATDPKADAKGAKDLPLLKRYEGSFIVDYAQKAFDEAALPRSELKRTDKVDSQNNQVYLPEEQQAVEGRLTRIVYIVPSGRSPLEVLRNYQEEITGKGGTVLYSCKGEECGGDAIRGTTSGGGKSGLLNILYPKGELKAPAFSNGACAVDTGRADQRYTIGKIPVEGGDAHVAVLTYALRDTLYCKALNERVAALVTVVEPKPREQKMVLVKAEEMGSAIGQNGRVALYGIFFDTDKAELKPESAETLGEIAKLLKSDPQLKLYVVGHTDNAGALDRNMKLSQQRAAAVVEALAGKYGVAKARLQSAGVGPVAPVASNADESGRAKNRRVELVRQ
jgi:outer membrane protein OmpA-like peptidoglycan-associated protein